MYKTVAAVIASAKMLVRKPSSFKMPDDDWRLLLHRALEIYHSFAIKEKKDFYTHELEATLTYVAGQLGFSMTVPISATVDSKDYYPIAIMYQRTEADPETDDWGRIRIVKYSSFLNESRHGRPIATFIGNEWQGIHDTTLKLNLTEDWVAAHRFRVAFRYFPKSILAFDDTVPFPAEHTSLLETYMAREALDLTEDNSPDWDKFYNRRVQTLEQRLKEGESSFGDWLNNDVENDIVVDTPYHYAYNNKLRSGRTPRRRVEWGS